MIRLTFRGLYLVVHVCEGGVIEDRGHCIAHLTHYHASAAALLINALIAPAIGCFAGAGERSEGTVDNANHFAYRDLVRGLGQVITSALAFLAFHQTFATKLKQYEFQELVRDFFGG